MLWWLSAGAHALPVPDLTWKLPPVALESGAWCFPSGLKVQGVRRPDAGLVAVSAVVAGGWSAERPDERGAAHLVEHLWFRSRPQGDYRVDDVLAGLTNQGYAGADETVFVTLADPADLPALLNIEALRLVDPLAGVTDSDVDHERRVVHNEHVARGEHVGRAATLELFQALFPPNEPYQAFPSVADNDALTADALRRYAARQYVPANVTLRIEGEVDPKGLEQLIARTIPASLLGGAATGCEHPRSEADPPDPANTALVRRPAPTLPTLTFGWSTPAGYHEEADAVGRRAAAWLTGRLQHAVELARRVDDDVGMHCEYAPMARASLLLCRVQLPSRADPEDVLRRVRAAVADRSADIDADAGWLVQSVSSFDRALASSDTFDPDALADRATFAHHVAGEIDPLGRTARGLHRAGPEVVEQYVERWITPDRMAAVFLEPAGPGAASDTTAIDGTAVLEATRRGAWQAPSVALRGWRVTEGPGLDVWMIPRPAGPPLTQVSAVFRGRDVLGEPGAWWADRDLSRVDIPRVLELLHGTATLFWTVHGPNTHHSAAMGPSGNLEAQLYAVRHQLGPITYFGRGASLHERRRDAREDLRRSPEAFVAAVVDDHLFPGHPEADAWWELDDDAAEVTRGEMRAWRRAVVRPSFGTVVVSGRIDADPAAEEVQTWLGSWRGESPGAPPAPALPEPLPRAVHGLVWDYPTVRTAVSCRLPDRSAENDAAFDVLDVLVWRGLEQTLRDRGAAYAYAAGIEDRDGAAVLTLRAEVGARSGRATVDAMFDLLGQIGAGASPSVVAWGRRAALNLRAERLASASSAHDLAVEALDAGLTFAEVEGWADRLEAVDAAALQAALAPCLAREVAVILAPAGTSLGADAAWWPWEAEAARLAR